MGQGMLELLEKISRSTSYLAVGGTVAVLFLLVFAQSIFGAKTTHSQLKKLIEQSERMNKKLEDIVRSMNAERRKPQNQDQADADAGQKDSAEA
jgi:predicted PurR-regulated permease PerM